MCPSVGFHAVSRASEGRGRETLDVLSLVGLPLSAVVESFHGDTCRHPGQLVPVTAGSWGPGLVLMITLLFTFHAALLAQAERLSRLTAHSAVDRAQPATFPGQMHAQHRVIEPVGSCTVAWPPSCPLAPHRFIGIDKVLLSLRSPRRYLDKVQPMEPWPQICCLQGDGAFTEVFV